MPEPKPRCYMEFCCNRATYGITVRDFSGMGRTPIPWGWCHQHVYSNTGRSNL